MEDLNKENLKKTNDIDIDSLVDLTLEFQGFRKETVEQPTGRTFLTTKKLREKLDEQVKKFGDIQKKTFSNIKTK